MKTASVRGSHRRGRSRSGAYCLCATATLLLISVTVLYSRLSITSAHPRPPPSLSDELDDDTDLLRAADDRIDELDDDNDAALEDDDGDDYDRSSDKTRGDPRSRSGYFYDHLSGAIRRRFRRRSIDDWDGDGDSYVGFGLLERGSEDPSKGVIGSDDVPVDEAVRRKAVEVVGIEDALMVKIAGTRASPLREGWGDWFDKKSDFLRRDKMFRSSFEVLNPLNNAMVQDPDGFGVTGFTRGDRLMQKLMLSEVKKVPFLMKKPLGSDAAVEVKRKDSVSKVVQRKSEPESHVYADGKRWGYYPGLRSDLSFSEFVDGFFGAGKCGLRVFMVWNSPPWMFSVRYQRGIESVLHHHPDACVLVLSETIELDFFKDSFVKDGYKVAVAMPNLDELLKDTPAHVFTSAWYEWRKTKYYATHYSELVRLAALYKYGGIYLDSDIIVLRPLASLYNSVGLEDQIKGSPLNGAVMAFRKHSPFVMECIKEFYMTYDDTRLKWNGAELLTRVATKFLKTKRKSFRELELKLQPSSSFYPISSRYITRYFISPTTDSEKLNHNALFDKIRNESLTFHFWNSITSSLIPEPDSLVAKLIDHTCIRCSDVL